MTHDGYSRSGLDKSKHTMTSVELLIREIMQSTRQRSHNPFVLVGTGMPTASKGG